MTFYLYGLGSAAAEPFTEVSRVVGQCGGILHDAATMGLGDDRIVIEAEDSFPKQAEFFLQPLGITYLGPFAEPPTPPDESGRPPHKKAPPDEGGRPPH